MGNRFHNKMHVATHYTTPVSGIPESASDPIASPNNPFVGTFIGDSIVVLGDAHASVPNGDIMHVNSIINSTATSAFVGITRLATSGEAQGEKSNESIISPRDLLAYSGVGKHKLLSPTHNSTDSSDTPINGDCFVFDGTNWVAMRPTGVYNQLSTNAEASGGLSNNTAITPEQMHREIRRNKSIFINNATASSINAIFSSMSANSNNILSGTLAFTNFIQTRQVGTGNGSGWKTFYGVSVWEWTGTTWIKRY